MIGNIETVCSGNHFRSKIAQAVFRKELERRRMDRVKVASSGTKVDEINRFNEAKGEERTRIMVPLMLTHLDTSVNYGIISQEEAEMFRRGENQEDILQKILEREKEQSRYRGGIVRDMGLEKYFDYDKAQQTVVRQIAELILPISEDNYKRVKNIYGPVRDKPRIELLGTVDDPIFGIYEDMIIAARDIERLSLERVSDIYDNN